MRTTKQPSVAYFSMEVGLRADMPTYSGGLGVLAGDTLKAAADLGVPQVAVTLLHRKGYFTQTLADDGSQTEAPAQWDPATLLRQETPRVQVRIDGSTVKIAAWRYDVVGASGHVIPVYFLDTDLPENEPVYRRLTDSLYGGDDAYRLAQEIVLGIGGVRMLEVLGHTSLASYHMNEGHSALLTLALLGKRLGGQPLAACTESDLEWVRSRCVFTTHTPVPAGHDRFSLELAQGALGTDTVEALRKMNALEGDTLNMTYLALEFSRYINGVAMQHGTVSRGMFPKYPIDSITNGVHIPTWTAPAFKELFDKNIPEWRKDSMYLRYAIKIPLLEIQHAHQRCKKDLIQAVQERTGVQLDPEALTLGFARRATAYKRADLLFEDLDRLRKIAQECGPIQVIYGGKAHPNDTGGKELIRKIFQAAESLKDDLRVVYLQEYDMNLGLLLTSGVDIWLNTPEKPHEASGTSGMKAAANGVPSLSVLDGWWIEGHVENATGWSIGQDSDPQSDRPAESSALYEKLEDVIAPMFYKRPDQFLEIRRGAIALNGSFFNAQRMVAQYVRNAYRLEHEAIPTEEAQSA